MAGASAADLHETLDVIERDRGLIGALVFGLTAFTPARCSSRVEQHRGVAIGQHEAIAVRPDRIIWIEAKKILPKRIDDWRQGHRRAGMP